MRKILLLLPLLLPALAPACLATEAAVLPSLAASNRLLQAELELARTKQLYFFCDTAQGRLLFRVSGATVAELAIAEVRQWGVRPADGRRTVLSKQASSSPEREKIGPAAEAPKEAKKESGPFQLKALEIDDMPTSFQVLLDDGLRLNVRSRPAGKTGRLREKVGLALWYLRRPLISDWYFLRGKPYTELLLVLPPRDAQRLYWSLAEGSPFLIAAPAS